MATTVGRAHSLSFLGTGCAVPKGDIHALSYFLMCINGVFCIAGISPDLIDYKNAHRLSSTHREALVSLCLFFNPKDIVNKLILVDDKHILLPKGNSNKFCSLHEVAGLFPVSADTTVGGKKLTITKIMLCTTSWLKTYWVAPMRSMKKLVESVTKKSTKEVVDFINSVESALQLYRLPEPKGKIELGGGSCASSSSSAPATTKHCSHCSGGETICFCKFGCARRKESECLDHPNVRCDRCGRMGLIGPRFTCRNCPGYDLCSNCYELQNDGHKKHSFVRIAKQGDTAVELAPRQAPYDHPNVQCDRCGKIGFDGARFSCQECEDFDLCQKCYEAEADSHLECRFWLIPQQGVARIDIPPRRARQAVPPPAMVAAKPIYTGGDVYQERLPAVVPAYPLHTENPLVATRSLYSQPTPTPSGAPASATASTDTNFSQGQTVRLTGLKESEWNDRKVVVDRALPGNKYVVAIPNQGGKKIFQAKNMELVVDDPRYPLNACVELTGLATMPSFNGKYGVIVKLEMDCVSVKLFDDDCILKVCKENLLVIDEAQ